MSLSALPYYGGKADHPAHRTGRWIASMLPPYRRDVLYAEPYSGMLGVLLQRPPAMIEIANDLDGRLVNWWRAVRDNPIEFGRLVDHTPWSVAEFDWALRSLDHPDDLRRALAYHIALEQSAMHGLGGSPSWRAFYSPTVHGVSRIDSSRIMALASRLRHVQMMQHDAVEILRRTAHIEQSVVYCDPPYQSADTSHYGVHVVDVDALTDALIAHRGHVAISGYADDWDHLLWKRHERTHKAIVPGQSRATPRIEVLWTNYEPTQRLL